MRKLAFFDQSVHLLRNHKRLAVMTASGLSLVCLPLAAFALNANMEPSADNGFNKAKSVTDVDVQAVSNDGSASSQASDSSKKETPAQSDISVSATQHGNQSPEVDVKVNGQSVDVPSSGSFHKTFTGNNGQSSVEVHVENSGDSQNYSNTSFYSSTSIQVNGHTQSSSSGSETNGEGGRHPDRR